MWLEDKPRQNHKVFLVYGLDGADDDDEDDGNTKGEIFVLNEIGHVPR